MRGDTATSGAFTWSCRRGTRTRQRANSGTTRCGFFGPYDELAMNLEISPNPAFFDHQRSFDGHANRKAKHGAALYIRRPHDLQPHLSLAFFGVGWVVRIVERPKNFDRVYLRPRVTDVCSGRQRRLRGMLLPIPGALSNRVAENQRKYKKQMGK
jgi:hypothetical protein